MGEVKRNPSLNATFFARSFVIPFCESRGLMGYATFHPSYRTDSTDLRGSAADADILPCHPAGLITDEKKHGAGNIRRLADTALK